MADPISSRRRPFAKELARRLDQSFRRDEPLIDHRPSMPPRDLLELALPDILEQADDHRMIGGKLPRQILDIAGRQTEIPLGSRLDGGFDPGGARSGGADAVAGDGGYQCIDRDCVFVLLQTAAFHAGDIAVLVLTQEDEGIRSY